MILDGSDMIFFFVFKNILYGAPESSRITFATMKDPDNTEGWKKEANFVAKDLYKLLDGEDSDSIFTTKELAKIGVVGDKKKVEKMMNDRVS